MDLKKKAESVKDYILWGSETLRSSTREIESKLIKSSNILVIKKHLRRDT